MRIYILLLLLSASSALNGQSASPQQLIYFNEEFYICAKEYAQYVGIAIAKDDGTDVIAYHLNGKQAMTGTYEDKNLQKRNGAFTWFDTNGIRIAVSEFKNNIQDGLYLFWYSNKVLRDSGTFSNGSPDGLWKSWYSNGQLKMVCAYNAKVLADYKKAYARNNIGSELVQAASPQKINNLARIDPAQDIPTRSRRGYYATLQEKEKQFNTVLNSEEQDKSSGTSEENDQRIYFSHVMIRYDLIIPATVLLDGNYYSFYANGNSKETGQYFQGAKKGFWETWYENGKRKSVGRFEKNHEVQEWKYYNEKGDLAILKQFKKDGRLINEIKMQ
ncbi:MAG: hypothetical protein HYX40_01860 [Sphingobacteriales bacterium]|nr:hypothetical protein [Sphingobacteriales bacterium]